MREEEMILEHQPIKMPAFLNGQAKKLLIDGKWVDAKSGRTFESINPSTGKQLDSLAWGGPEDIDLAVAAARRAFEGPWSKFTPNERHKVLLRLAELVEQRSAELALLDTVDMGGPLAITNWVMGMTVDTFRYNASRALNIHGETLSNSLPISALSYTLREPVGVVGGIIPWNGPVFNACWKIAPVLASGCTLVLKCAEQAALSPLLLGELCLEAGVPPGVINVVTGFGDAGAALAEHMDVDKVAFTGSTETGQKIVRASAGNLKRLTMELGGKSPDIVFADANLDAAVPGAAMGIFGNSGQACLAGSRLFVERPVYEEFTEKVAAFANSLKIGDPTKLDTMIGPVVSKEQMERISGYLQAGVAEGAKAISGGERVTEGELADGYFIPPTTFVGVEDSMSIAKEEIFGPVVSAIPFDDVDEVITRANATPYGLASGVWTSNVDKAMKVSRSLRAGTVWVNSYSLMDPGVPFGGYKMSGYGMESGPHHVEEYLHTKAVWIAHS